MLLQLATNLLYFGIGFWLGVMVSETVHSLQRTR